MYMIKTFEGNLKGRNQSTVDSCKHITFLCKEHISARRCEFQYFTQIQCHLPKLIKRRNKLKRQSN